jgi:outer membrane autotransporter protein
MLSIKRSWRETTALAGRLCVFANETPQEFSPKRAGSLPPLLSLAVLLVTLGGGVASVQAQQRFITLIPGLTPPQAAVGRAIETLCPPLATAPAGTPFTPAQNDLISRCSEMVVNSGTNPEAVRGALLPVAPEEVPAQGNTSVEFSRVQQANIAARLSALRGVASGRGIRGVSLNGNGDTFAGALASLSPSGSSTAAAGAEASRSLPRLGVFLNGTLTLGDKDATSREAGFDLDAVGLTAGLDYRLMDSLILGAAFSYTSTEADLDSSGGNVDVDRYMGSIYGLYYIGERFYLDGIASFGGNAYDMRRNILYQIPGVGLATGTTTSVNQTAESDTDGTEYSFGLGAGYDFHLRGFTFGPFGRLNYGKAELDGYQETIKNTGDGSGLNLAFGDQDVDSLTTVLGAQVSYAISTGWGVVLPQFRLEWEHEFLNDSRTIQARFVNDPARTAFGLTTEDPDRDFFNLGAGLSAVFARGRSAFLYYETVLGLRDITAHNIVAGVRLTF